MRGKQGEGWVEHGRYCYHTPSFTTTRFRTPLASAAAVEVRKITPVMDSKFSLWPVLLLYVRGSVMPLRHEYSLTLFIPTKTLRSRRLLGEDPPDIESPLSGDNKTYSGAEVTRLHFTAEHHAALKAATQEVFSLKEGNEKREIGVNVARPDDSFGATRIRSGRKRIRSAILLLASGVAVACIVLYAARRAKFAT